VRHCSIDELSKFSFSFSSSYAYSLVGLQGRLLEYSVIMGMMGTLIISSGHCDEHRIATSVM